MRYPVSVFEWWLLVWVLLDTTTLNLCSAQTNEPCTESSRGEIRVIGIHCTTGVAGRILICDGTRWRAVCDTGWEFADARVVCRQLGFSNAVGNCRQSCFGKSEGVRGVRRFNCPTNENRLINCEKENVNNCGKDAGVICGSISCLQDMCASQTSNGEPTTPETTPPDCTECPQDTCPEPETTPCDCTQSPSPSTRPTEQQDSYPETSPCSATQVTAIGGALGALAAGLGLALVGVVMGWVWHCHRHRHHKQQYNIERNISGASLMNNPCYNVSKPHPSIQYSSQGPRDTPLNTSPTETSFATYDVVGSPTHTHSHSKGSHAPQQERVYQVVEGPGEGRKEGEGPDYQEEGEEGGGAGLTYEVPIPTATLEQPKKQADTNYSSLQHH